MASYSIVLNLSGNAVTRAEKLATVLATANANAAKLAANLAAVGGAARAIPANPIRIPYNSAVRAPNIAQSASNAAHVNAGRNYTRHPHTRIASYGYGFNIGGFSGRLSTILQPDENGMLLGMDAGKLMRAANVSGIALSLAKSVGKLVLKSTLYPNLLSGGTLFALTKVLQSEFIGRGVALNSRRLMAQNVLGADYEYANSQADFLASTYGIDRGITLGNIAALSGLNVGKHEITPMHASEITRIGGLIASQSGAPMERVMTNLQQLISQVNPNLRDIRELINQAPILGRYALKEMKDQGMQGGDYRTALKDRSFLLQTLSSFALDNPLTPTMVARGQISNAIANAGALIAGNDNAWGSVGVQAVYMIRILAEGANNLITALSANPDFLVAVNNLAIGFEKIGQNAGKFSDTIWSFASFMEKTFGIDIGNREDAADRTARTWALRSSLDNPEVLQQARQKWEARNGTLYADDNKRDRAFNQWYRSIVANALLSDQELLNAVAPIQGVGRYGMLEKGENLGLLSNNRDAQYYRYGLTEDQSKTLYRWGKLGSGISEPARFQIGTSNILDTLATNAYFRPAPDVLRKGMFGGYIQPVDPILAAIDKLVEKGTYGSLSDLFGGAKPTGGEDLTGVNRDRRALEIHFHAPIAEVTNNIQTSDPQQAAMEVFENANEAMSAGIQKALLGASNKMSSRWY